MKTTRSVPRSAPVAVIVLCVALFAAIIALLGAFVLDLVERSREAESLGSACYFLAGERFALDSARGQVCIMSVKSMPFHKMYKDNGTTVNVREYGDVLVVELPYEDGDDSYGLRHFAGHYNQFLIAHADEHVLAGRYDDARKIYQALVRFAPVGPESVERNLASERLRDLKRLENGDPAAVEGFRWARSARPTASWFKCAHSLSRADAASKGRTGPK